MANNIGKVMSNLAQNALIAMGAGAASFIGSALVKGGLKMLTRSNDVDTVDYVTDEELAEEVCAEETTSENIVLTEE